MIEPNCDMPWDIYLDWLQDQGCEDFREFDPSYLTSTVYIDMYSYNLASRILCEGSGYSSLRNNGDGYNRLDADYFDFHSGAGIYSHSVGLDGGGIDMGWGVGFGCMNCSLSVDSYGGG